MHPTITRLATQNVKNNIKNLKGIPQYQLYLKRIPDLAVWSTLLFSFFVWPSTYVWLHRIVHNVPQGKNVGNRGLFY
ncbi:uncharacterized protein KGF55_003084 [Candida pseudojiufengensis]|uniref:uncharacterized protein n=1 Tax=Candida pseudojiufengensis TaxID=497109 RepID=UPI002225158A|nr:uncharacterized protein KGF55_003084 [Candida pseudojiufengensis]KAI5963292.1 hypothetical protein KGF55_003084 [Candida pseudojiufengensis]